ncbi:hypothetical protein CEV34_4775 [Brucella pseudogrignonensis]|uniref:Uncharacterized protein n=1 Tax=Brucella pseudogrignonensis TaxID=419475 RepID=A0A256G4F9_9HYPH|nr:hypothetical protein CEV34_4775 [Brucella pseudogrignonensis]
MFHFEMAMAIHFMEVAYQIFLDRLPRHSMVFVNFEKDCLALFITENSFSL